MVDNTKELEEIKLDIGCGRNKKPGFIGIDIDENVRPDITASALDLPFANNSVTEIYCSHLVEHFNPQQAEIFFNEIHRVLKEGGKAFIKIDKDWTIQKLLVKDSTHQYRYKVKEIKAMVEKFSKQTVKDKIYFFGYRLKRKIYVNLVK